MRDGGDGDQVVQLGGEPRGDGLEVGPRNRVGTSSARDRLRVSTSRSSVSRYAVSTGLTTAPMRRQAAFTQTISAQLGSWTETTSPRPTPCPLSQVAMRAARSSTSA